MDSKKPLELVSDAGAEIEIRCFPVLSAHALHGLAGEIAREASKDSESDPVAILAQTLSLAGAYFGNEVYCRVADTNHAPRLNVIVVGRSAKARKGTSWGPVSRIAQETNKKVSPLKISPGPVVSGEGLIYAVRDAGEKLTEDGSPVDPGVSDKRLLVCDGEIASMFTARKREGNTVSTMVRCFWDNGNVEPLTKTNPIKTTGAHVCIVGHITRDELRNASVAVDVFNGFLNRFLFVCARRTRLVPRPTPLSDEFVNRVSSQLAERVTFARQVHGEVPFSGEAGYAWDGLYAKLSQEVPGIVGSIVARSEPQVRRLALIYALLDKKDVIGVDHLKAAVAFWQYCEDSARYLWENNVETDEQCNQIVQILTTGPKTVTEITKEFSCRLSGPELSAKLQKLEEIGAITMDKIPSKGRPTTLVSLVGITVVS